jgi:hypothetical protein
MLTNGSEPINTAFFRPALAATCDCVAWPNFSCNGTAEALAQGEPAVFDLTFIAEHTELDDSPGVVDASSWDPGGAQSGLCLTFRQHTPSPTLPPR